MRRRSSLPGRSGQKLTLSWCACLTAICLSHDWTWARGWVWCPLCDVLCRCPLCDVVWCPLCDVLCDAHCVMCCAGAHAPERARICWCCAGSHLSNNCFWEGNDWLCQKLVGGSRLPTRDLGWVEGWVTKQCSNMRSDKTSMCKMMQGLQMVGQEEARPNEPQVGRLGRCWVGIGRLSPLAARGRPGHAFACATHAPACHAAAGHGLAAVWEVRGGARSLPGWSGAGARQPSVQGDDAGRGGLRGGT